MFFLFCLLVGLCSHERAFRIAQHPRPPLLAHYETYHRQHRQHRSICAYNLKHTHARSRDVTLGNHFNHLCAYNVHYACTCAVFFCVARRLADNEARDVFTNTHTHILRLVAMRRKACDFLNMVCTIRSFTLLHNHWHVCGALVLTCSQIARWRIFVRAAWQLLLTFIDFEKTNM